MAHNFRKTTSFNPHDYSIEVDDDGRTHVNSNGKGVLQRVRQHRMAVNRLTAKTRKWANESDVLTLVHKRFPKYSHTDSQYAFRLLVEQGLVLVRTKVVSGNEIRQYKSSSQEKDLYTAWMNESRWV